MQCTFPYVLIFCAFCGGKGHFFHLFIHSDIHKMSDETACVFRITEDVFFLQTPYMTVHHSTPRTTGSLASTNCQKMSSWEPLS